jgi:hypothetical protein
MEPDSRRFLTDVRHGLLRLHKALLDWERSTYERTHGRQSGGELLKLLLDDPHFAWLRPMSQMIVRIDEMLEDDMPAPEPEVDDVATNVNIMTSPGERTDGHGPRYDAALRASPDAVLAHRDLVARLKRGR